LLARGDGGFSLPCRSDVAGVSFRSVPDQLRAIADYHRDLAEYHHAKLGLQRSVAASARHQRRRSIWHGGIAMLPGRVLTIGISGRPTWPVMSDSKRTDFRHFGW
jgi:hypothetical protein